MDNLDVLKQLQKVIAEQLNNYLLDEKPIDINNVKIDFPDPDRMNRNTMFWIVPDSEQLEDLTTCSDLSTMYVTVDIFSKRDRNESLVNRVFEYYNALYLLVRNNSDLDEFVDFVNVTSSEFYPAVTADAGIVGMEVALEVQFAKEWSR